MNIFIDADGCPVRKQAIKIASQFSIPVILVCDTSHIITEPDCETITVDKQSDSADYAIINRLNENDICITQDYGLAAMVIAKNGIAVHQNGFLYTNENIDRMLFERHVAKQVRMAGKRSTKHKARSKENDEKFQMFFDKFIKQLADKNI